MTREQAIRYLRASGFSAEQIKAIEEAFKPEWILCSEKLPTLYREVLIFRYGLSHLAKRTDFTRDGSICWVDERQCYFADGDKEIHYWMPLPEPMKEGE